MFVVLSHIWEDTLSGLIEIIPLLMHLNYFGQCPVFLHPEFSSRHTYWEGGGGDAAAAADGLVATTSSVLQKWQKPFFCP